MTDLNNFNYTDNVHDVLAVYVNRLLAATLRSEYANTETINATRELSDADTPFQILTASGGNQTVELAPEADTNHISVIENGGASNNLVLKDDSGVTTFITLAPGEQAMFIPVKGKTWRVVEARATLKNYFDTVYANKLLNDGWIGVTETWTYASATTITIPTDGTTKYAKGMRIRFKQGGGYKYFVAYSVAATLITTFPSTDYSVANAAITDVAYSFIDKPFGFPVTFNYAGDWTGTGGSGFAKGNANLYFRWKEAGGLCFAKCLVQTVVGGTTTFGTGVIYNFTLPVSPADIVNGATLESAAGNVLNASTRYALASFIRSSDMRGIYGNSILGSGTVTWALGDEIRLSGWYEY